MADYDSQKKADLQAEADERGIEYSAKATKAELVELLVQDDAASGAVDTGKVAGPGALPHPEPDDHPGYLGYAPGADNDHTFQAEVKRLNGDG